MICECYAICDEMVYLRYDILRYNMFDDVLMIWYVNIMIYDMTWYVCIIDLAYVWHDWHTKKKKKWWIGTRYNPDIHMTSYDKMIWYKGKR